MSALKDGAVLVNATRFRSAHAEGWERLDSIVSRMERRSVRVIDEEDLLALPVLYRIALSSLSVARETSLDRALVSYLEQLCTRAYFQIYGSPASAWLQLAEFFKRGWALAVQALWRETLVATALTLLGAVLGYMLVNGDPAWFYTIVPDALAQGRDPSASAADLREVLYSGDETDPLVTFATYLFTHNAQVAIFAFALGFAFALPTAMLLVYNGLMLGAFMSIYVAKGLGYTLGGWLIIHGSTEFFAIILAGAAGFKIGLAAAFPDSAARLDAAVLAGRVSGTAMTGVVLMLVVAGLLEGIGRQTVQADWQRYALGLSIFGCWLIYFYTARGQRAQI